jgi:plasmid stabilization system protein ParE
VNGFILHAEAFGDIDEIRAYIAEDDPDDADRVVTAIFDRIRVLVQLPIKAIAAPI